jgi:hypothetical protein
MRCRYTKDFVDYLEPVLPAAFVTNAESPPTSCPGWWRLFGVASGRHSSAPAYIATQESRWTNTSWISRAIRDPLRGTCLRDIAATIANESRPRTQTVADYDLTFSPGQVGVELMGGRRPACCRKDRGGQGSLSGSCPPAGSSSESGCCQGSKLSAGSCSIACSGVSVGCAGS